MKFYTPFSKLLVALAIVAGGCAPAYVPNRQHVPLLQQKGEFKAAVNPRNLQLAYAPDNNIAVMLNGFYRQRGYSRDENCFLCDVNFENVKERHWLIEAGLGYFGPISRDSTWRAELYSGFGMGPTQVRITSRRDSVEYVRSLEAMQNRFFVQPAICRIDEYYEVALSCRISAVGFTQPKVKNYTASEFNGDGFRTLLQQRHYLIEPAFSFRVGGEALKFETQFGVLVPLRYSARTDPKAFVRPRALISGALYFTLGNRATRSPGLPVLR